MIQLLRYWGKFKVWRTKNLSYNQGCCIIKCQIIEVRLSFRHKDQLRGYCTLRKLKTSPEGLIHAATSKESRDATRSTGERLLPSSDGRAICPLRSTQVALMCQRRSHHLQLHSVSNVWNHLLQRLPQYLSHGQRWIQNQKPNEIHIKTNELLPKGIMWSENFKNHWTHAKV